MTEHIKHLADLCYTVVAKPDAYSVAYTVHTIIGFGPSETEPGVYDVPCWESAREGVSDAESLKDAAIFLHGYVKWDGCSNWHFDEQEQCMLHGCSRSDLTNIGEVMARCWDWTAELCPHWNAEVAA